MKTGLALTALAASAVMSFAPVAEAATCIRCDSRGCRITPCESLALPPEVCEILQVLSGDVDCPSTQ